jgi:seryl-tRNA synthetase
MHDIRWIRENPEAFDRGLARRGRAPEAARLIAIDERRRAIIRVHESWRSSRNAASKEIGQAKAKNDEATVQRLMAVVEECKASLSATEAEEKAVQKELDTALAEIPNLPLGEVPDGSDEHGNLLHHKYFPKRDYSFAYKPKQHFELGEVLGQMDFEAAAKLSGSRFVVLKKGLARMERALGQFMLDLHTNKHGYTEVAPPLMVRDAAMFGTAQLPKFEDDQYYGLSIRPMAPPSDEATKIQYELANFARIGDEDYTTDVAILDALKQLKLSNLSEDDWDEIRGFVRRTVDMKTGYKSDLEKIVGAIREHFAQIASERRWLIPTAEVPLTNLVRESILEESELPMRLTALTPCFRAEAGAAGKDTRGMIRQHQFTKVELVSITTPEESGLELERMLSCAEQVLQQLELHYRVMTLCAGDMGFPSQKTYDIEVWLPGQNMYREISSCSVCGDFQARRMAARYRTKDPSTKAQGRQVRHVHTLNGSGVAVGRALIAVMETYQQADGSIAVPDVLQSYMGGMKVVAAK